MFDPIFERLMSYNKVVSSGLSKHSSRLINVAKNINSYISMISNKIRYQIQIKKEYNKLGNYLSSLDSNKYDLSNDKYFENLMNRVMYTKKLLDKNNEDLSLLYKKDKKMN